ncbi:MAG: N-acetylmuramoyl-L-alanine amidase [Bacteroidota bacterium]
MKKLYVFACILLLSASIQAQSFRVTKTVVNSSITDTCFSFPDSITSVSLHSDEAIDFTDILIISDSATYIPHKEGIDTETENGMWSELIIFKHPQTHLCISKPAHKSITFSGIYVQPFTKTEKPSTVQLKSSSCSNVPSMIYQEEWRTGLPAPDYERIYTETKNIIIHHSAGSNSEANYTDVIRNIYTYHTEIREWDDIGYNYLIAQNGVIYAGRDPGEFPQDMVQGAHFSGNNAHTLGICVLGNYEEVSVPDTAYQSLQKLITWKCAKDSLQPLLTAPHPLNSKLPVIAGHTDGAATLCPGDYLYNSLPILRNEVADSLRQCGYTIATDLPEIAFHNQTSKKQFISDTELCYVFTIQGQLIAIDIFEKLRHYMENPMYVIVPIKNGKSSTHKF